MKLDKEILQTWIMAIILLAGIGLLLLALLMLTAFIPDLGPGVTVAAPPAAPNVASTATATAQPQPPAATQAPEWVPTSPPMSLHDAAMYTATAQAQEAYPGPVATATPIDEAYP